VGLGADVAVLGLVDEATTADDGEGDAELGAGLAGEPQPAITDATTIADANCLIEVFMVVSFGRYDRETPDLSVCNDMDVSAFRHPPRATKRPASKR
jgi:hypothetical protein